jgi:K+-transporting ATPase ATPase C chain
MWRQITPALRMTLLMTVLTGLIYPGVVTGLCQLVFRNQANGSLVSAGGRTVGSSLIGQNFTKPGYLQPRPSAAGNGYDGLASGGSNLGPTNDKLAARVKDSVEKFRKENPGVQEPLPADLVTTSGSGLDPHVSPASADVQVDRIARARGWKPEQVREVIARHTEGRTLGFLGERRVNVLAVNLDLDQTR